MSLPRRYRTTLSRGSNSYTSMGEILGGGHRKQSALIVDDNPVNATLLKELLSSHGYPAIAVQSAIAAEAEIWREAPDLILLDVIMPGKTGYELCRELKNGLWDEQLVANFLVCSTSENRWRDNDTCILGSQL